MALLNVDKLSVHFGDEGTPFRAVDRISYSVNQGEVVGIVGESGSGKSVSSLAIMGLIDYPGRVMAEKLEFNGQDLQRISEKERRNLVGAEVAMIFQDPMTSLNPCYTVGFQIMEAIKVHQGGNKKTRRQRAIDLLTQVGIPDPASRLDVYPHQLSGGMSQRVMIAMAIACRPKLLIADEPTTALDVTIQAQIIELLLELQQNLAKTQDVIMDGRDIGTCVLPGADVKIYLTASVETRAKRRYDELKEKGEDCNLEEIAHDIEERDHRDMTREIAPLKQAEDAVLVDSSHMTIEEVVKAIVSEHSNLAPSKPFVQESD